MSEAIRHFVTRSSVELTNHEKTILMIRLDPSDSEHREIGRKLAYNREWKTVFKERES